MTDHLSSDIRQHETHKELLGRDDLPGGASPGRTLDAIVVPASRPAASLDHAITLARATRSRLLVLCSRQARATEVNQLLAARSFSRAVVLDLPNGYSHRLLKFATSQLVHIGFPRRYASRRSDLSVKRNIGLILARMLGWECIFFMDDDIRDVDSADLRRTLSMLGPYNTVGMRVTNFPDNSVVCHAHRETGEFQDVSVSGSALAVDCTAPIDFFPDIYNEDWFFFYRDAIARKLGCSGQHATQLRYDPFANPRRAASEEFGDILAEGLYALLHQGAGALQATQSYWLQFLDARRTFLDAIIKRSEVVEGPLRKKIVAAVKAAQYVAAQIRPDMCERYVTNWLLDRQRWQQDLKDVPRKSSVAEALDFLGFAASASSLGQRLHEAQAPPGASPAGPALIRSVTAFNGMSRRPVLAASSANAVSADGTAIPPDTAGIAEGLAIATMTTSAGVAAPGDAAATAPGMAIAPATQALGLIAGATAAGGAVAATGGAGAAAGRAPAVAGPWTAMRMLTGFLQMCSAWRGRGQV